MSITAYKVEAVGHDRTGEDYGYVNIMYRYGNKQSCPRPDQCEKMEVMWADESVYGPPAPGSKVGDFIQTWLMGSWDCGVFTHREIAQRLMDTFTGLKIKELAWFENPREKTLKNGKPRARRAKWLPDREVDLVYLYSDRYLDARNPSPAETDFFTVTRMDAWGMSTWFMCTPEAAGKLIAMDYDNLAVQETTIVGYCGYSSTAQHRMLVIPEEHWEKALKLLYAEKFDWSRLVYDITYTSIGAAVVEDFYDENVVFLRFCFEKELLKKNPLDRQGRILRMVYLNQDLTNIGKNLFPALLDKFLAFYDRKGKTSLETMLQRWYIALEKEYRSQTAE